MYNMYWTSILVIAIVAAFPSWVNGQQSGWAANQVNATMCIWKGLRTAQLRDTAYMDGGFLFWVPGFADNTLGFPEQDGNPLGIIYTLNFSVPWDSKTNISSILNTVFKAPNGGAANNLAPNYYDGAMLANDSQFFLYGGLVRNTNAYSPPGADEVLAYQAYDSGIPKQGFRPGFFNDDLPNGVTRYVTYGGAANAPSENKAWYFGGSRSESGGPIYQPSFNNSVNPLNHSKRLITLDIGSKQSPKWTNTSLPDSIPSRANPSVVWVPVGEQGILVVLGGVTYPQYATANQTSLNEAQSNLDGPGYMSNIDIYDIANGTWYQQPTIPGPPMLALGCAVVATAQDASSYNIYYYGGFDGIHANGDFNDDVWVLSLPSFIWTKVSQGKESHARAGHQCLTPYPDQMITIGGYRPLVGSGIKCLDGGILQIFNLTEGTWLDSYDPNSWNVYGVPEKVHAKIGGDYSGGATLTAPSPTGWATPALASVFATKYPTSKLTTYYPYASQGPGNSTRSDWNNPSKGGGGTPSWVAPVLGVVLGLVFLTAIAVGILLWRRRGLLSKRNSGSDSVPYDRHHRIRKWLNSTGDKEQTITTEEVSREDMESRNEGPLRHAGYFSPSPPIPEMTQHEMPGNPGLFELPDTSATAELGSGADAERRGSAARRGHVDHRDGVRELSDEGLSHIDVLMKHTQLHSPLSPHSGSPHSLVQPTSSFMGSVSQEQPSSLSSSQAGMPPPSVAATLGVERPDSPSLGTINSMRRTPPPNRDAVVSDLSRISEHHMSHLRNLSAGTVSSTSAASIPPTPPAIQTGFNGPVSPPLPSPPSALDGDDAGDYVSVHQSRNAHAGPSRVPGTSSSLRQSIFRENTDDLGDSPTRATYNTR
ncbi:hypothetical protein GGR58DRAFT_161003 [Xylaria digitata]|nr:hypothetical protein GGR58DRAFT_161003 [Xylaria digitata]